MVSPSGFNRQAARHAKIFKDIVKIGSCVRERRIVSGNLDSPRAENWTFRFLKLDVQLDANLIATTTFLVDLSM